MKKINIILLVLFASSTVMNSMQKEASNSSSSNTQIKTNQPIPDSSTTSSISSSRTAQTQSNKAVASASSSSSFQVTNTSSLLKIPMTIEKPANVPDGVIKDDTLYLDLNSEVPMGGGGSFAELIDEQLAVNKPVILAVATTKINGVYNYHFYEADTTNYFYSNDFSRDRYKMSADQFPTEPTNRQPIINEIMFFILYDKNKPVEYIGSDKNLFEGTDDQKSFVRNTLLANKEINPDVNAMYYLGNLYNKRKNFELAEQYYKQALQSKPDSEHLFWRDSLLEIEIQQKLDDIAKTKAQAATAVPFVKLKKIPFWSAIDQGDFETVNWYLRHGRSPDTSRNNVTALSIAAQNGHKQIVACLIKAGANVNRPNRGGDTALIFAIRAQQVPIVQQLINAGAVKDWSIKRKAILLATELGNEELVKLLLIGNVAKSTLNKAEKIADENGYINIKKMLEEYQIHLKQKRAAGAINSNL